MCYKVQKSSFCSTFFRAKYGFFLDEIKLSERQSWFFYQNFFACVKFEINVWVCLFHESLRRTDQNGGTLTLFQKNIYFRKDYVFIHMINLTSCPLCCTFTIKFFPIFFVVCYFFCARLA